MSRGDTCSGFQAGDTGSRGRSRSDGSTRRQPRGRTGPPERLAPPRAVRPPHAAPRPEVWRHGVGGPRSPTPRGEPPAPSSLRGLRTTASLGLGRVTPISASRSVWPMLLCLHVPLLKRTVVLLGGGHSDSYAVSSYLDYVFKKPMSK